MEGGMFKEKGFMINLAFIENRLLQILLSSSLLDWVFFQYGPLVFNLGLFKRPNIGLEVSIFTFYKQQGNHRSQTMLLKNLCSM